MDMDTLVQVLHDLNRQQKYQVLHLLIDDLAQTETLAFIEGATYEVWSPQDTSSAAETLLAMLDQEKSSSHE